MQSRAKDRTATKVEVGVKKRMRLNSQCINQIRISGNHRLPWGAQNYLNRVLKPAAIRARVGLFKRKTRKAEEVESSDVNFQVLRRTCATLFGAKAKDPRDTQAQLRHADPSVTLRHYQKSIPASVRAAALALECELIGESRQSIRTGFEQVRN